MEDDIEIEEQKNNDIDELDSLFNNNNLNNNFEDEFENEFENEEIEQEQVGNIFPIQEDEQIN